VNFVDEISVGDDAMKESLCFTIDPAFDHRGLAEMGQQVNFTERGQRLYDDQEGLAERLTGVKPNESHLLRP
jgi:hypothetical protein